MNTVELAVTDVKLSADEGVQKYIRRANKIINNCLACCNEDLRTFGVKALSLVRDDLLEFGPTDASALRDDVVYWDCEKRAVVINGLVELAERCPKREDAGEVEAAVENALRAYVAKHGPFLYSYEISRVAKEISVELSGMLEEEAMH